MDLGIQGKVALVTAASRGLGRASAEALAAEGAEARDLRPSEGSLLDAGEALAAQGAEVLAMAADIDGSRRSGPPHRRRRRAIRSPRHRGGQQRGAAPGTALELDDDAIRAAVEANLLSSVRLVRGALPYMRAEGWGRLCCISSYSVVQPIPGLALSNTARSGLRAWAKTAAADLAAEDGGITLNLVCPGPHATDRMRELGGSGGPWAIPPTSAGWWRSCARRTPAS